LIAFWDTATLKIISPSARQERMSKMYSGIMV
jgi:hypothetical protein